MNKTPVSKRPHIVLLGKVNSGKSTIFNQLLGQNASIISDVAGTTTDPVQKTMELIDFGPIVLIDTAGLYDVTILGQEREAKTLATLDRADLIIYVDDATSFDHEAYERVKNLAKRLNVDMLHVVSKSDLVSEEKLFELKEEHQDVICFSNGQEESIDLLKTVLVKRLRQIWKDEEDASIMKFVSPGEIVLMVTPIDSEAPKGRLIAPQVQLIRECLDNGIISVVTRVEELLSTLEKLVDVALVVTDSQAFAQVSKVVPEHIELTSFSIIQSFKKGGFDVLLKGTHAIDNLSKNSKILIAESCTHNTSHEDIGRVKIPNLLEAKLGEKFEFTFVSGNDFPRDVSSYDLVIHCGGCMMNRRSMLTRIAICEEAKVPITNYGMTIAHLNGILHRSSRVILRRQGDN